MIQPHSLLEGSPMRASAIRSSIYNRFKREPWLHRRVQGEICLQTGSTASSVPGVFGRGTQSPLSLDILDRSTSSCFLCFLRLISLCETLALYREVDCPLLP
jgi:hypothetical protein